MSLASAFDVSRGNVPLVAADPDDDIFLLCAVEADATYIVTNDKHLLRLNPYREIPILTLEEFFRRVP
jgi:predicted nucleic acid-binding protein